MELQVFSNAEFGSVRSIMVNNEPYFVGKDVAEILGYSNPRDALARHVDEEDKDAVGIHDAIGRQQDTILINESGLYSLMDWMMIGNTQLHVGRGGRTFLNPIAAKIYNI